MAEEQAAAVVAGTEGGEGETQVLDIDPAQLAALLAQSADGTAQLIDEHGNTITLTAEQLAEAGIDLQNLEGAQVVQLAEGQQYVQGEDGQIYIIEGGDAALAAAVAGGYVDAGAVVASQQMESAGSEQILQKSHYPQSSEQSGASSRPAVFSAASPTPKQLQVPPPIMAAPKPIPTVVQNQQQSLVTSSRRTISGVESDHQIGMRREHGEPLSSPKMHYARRPLSDQYQQQFGDDMMGTNQMRSQQTATPQILRRGNFQSGLLPFQCDHCPRRFAHDNHLKRHQEMAHAKKRAFYCRYCNRDLYLASDLHFQGHLRMQHKQELDYEATYAATGHSRSGGGQQQLQLRTASATPANAGQSSYVASSAMDEQVEEEPDWDSLDADRQRESQATEEKQNESGGEAAAAVQAVTTEDKDKGDSAVEEDLQEKEGGEHKCGVCGKEYATVAGLSKHEEKEHRMEVESERPSEGEKQKDVTPSAVYTCTVCEKQFSKQEYLDKHKILHTDQHPFTCQYCPRRFKWKENLVKHINWHMERMPFKCAMCPKGFPTQTRLDVHIKAKHMPKQREHVCPICAKAFYEKEYLTKHMRIHGSKIYPCTECDKKFIDEKFLRRHMATHTQTRDFACDVCGKTFVKATHLKSHRTIHTGDRPYKCSKCHLLFGFKHNLRAHEKSEHAPGATDRTHICEYCGRGFTQKNNLEVHLRVHKGVKPFQCSSCLKQFSRLEHLRAHVNAHAGIRDHQCTVCEKYFSSKSNLRQHLLVHQEENERAFQCGSCPKKFKQRPHLAKHVKTHTKNTDVQYVVIWEKGGSLLEATIITDGVAQDATGDANATGTAVSSEAASANVSQDKVSEVINMDAGRGSFVNIPTSGLAYSQQQQPTTLQVSEAEAAKLLAAGGQVLDLSQVQLVDEHGNPVQGLGTDQLLILQDGTIATASGAQGVTSTTIATSSAEAGTAVLDPSALLALAAEAQGEDGTIYISEENLQALAQQGVVFSYEEAAQ